MDSVAHGPSLSETAASLEQAFKGLAAVGEPGGERESAAQALSDIRTLETILARAARQGPVRTKKHLRLYRGGRV